MDSPQTIAANKTKTMVVGSRSYDLVDVRGQWFFQLHGCQEAGWTCASPEFTRVINGLPPLPVRVSRPETVITDRPRIERRIIKSCEVTSPPVVQRAPVPRRRLRTGTINDL